MAPVRDQGRGRNTCGAVAASALHQSVRPDDIELCIEYLNAAAAEHIHPRWKGNGISLLALSEALRLTGQPGEPWWPYDPHGPNGDKPEDAQPLYKCKTVLRQLSTEGVRTALEAHMPLLLAVHVTEDWYKKVEHPYIIPTGSPQGLGHAVVAAGLGKDAEEQLYLLISNTWGDTWGKNGFAWLPWEYVVDNFVGYLQLESTDVH